MGNGTHFAIALILFWIAAVCFFVAFHPGGIKIGDRQAQNPVDVLKYLISIIAKGTMAKPSDQPTPQGSTGGGTVGT